MRRQRLSRILITADSRAVLPGPVAGCYYISSVTRVILGQYSTILFVETCERSFIGCRNYAVLMSHALMTAVVVLTAAQAFKQWQLGTLRSPLILTLYRDGKCFENYLVCVTDDGRRIRILLCPFWCDHLNKSYLAPMLTHFRPVLTILNLHYLLVAKVCG